MDFDLSADQKLLVETARNFAKKESPVSRIRALRDDPLGYSPAIWKQMGELGWLGVMFPEDVGGYGGSFVDAALILVELGKTLVPEPFIPSVVLAGSALAKAGSPAQREKHLEPMLAGDTTLALAYAERDGRYDPLRVATTADKKVGRVVLHGEKRFVLGGHAASALIVSARAGGDASASAGLSLVVVDPKQKGVTVKPLKTMDGPPAADVVLDGVEVGDENVVGTWGEAGPLLEELIDRGAAAACAEGAGLLRTVLDMTVEYLKTREQFGVKIGTFQALQHRAVDMFIEAELAKSMSILAMLKVDESDVVERKRAISAAKAQLSVSGKLVTQQAVQLHGGIGVTDEHDVTLFFKRMHVLNSLFGDEEHHVARFASLPSFASAAFA